MANVMDKSRRKAFRAKHPGIRQLHVWKHVCTGRSQGVDELAGIVEEAADGVWKWNGYVGYCPRCRRRFWWKLKLGRFIPIVKLGRGI